MLTLLLGTDWIMNRDYIMHRIADDISIKKGGRILMVPELISHDAERRLCKEAGNTACRYAEVLSFSRLAKRVAEAVGHAAGQCLDNGGRVVAMAAATRQLHSKLKAYASVETKPEFLSALVEAVDEFKRCCVSSDDLMRASKMTDGLLAQKLEELSLILSCYDGICSQGANDPRDQMTWLLEELAECTYAHDHVFYIDFFPDFTRQHMAVMEHLIRFSPNVTVSLNCDCIDTRNPAFEEAAETAAELINTAKKWGVAVSVEMVASRDDQLNTVRDNLFHNGSRSDVATGVLEVYQTETVYQECIAASHRVLELVQNGARYRDICLVLGDPKNYQNTLRMVFERCHIPMYLSGTENLLNHAVISSLVAALNAAFGGFERQDVLKYLKSVLSPLNVDETDLIENYAYLWSVDANTWLNNWTNHPKGLNADWNEEAYTQLHELNNARKLLIDPLEKFRDNFNKSETLSQQVIAFYDFLDSINLSERLSVYAEILESRGEYAEAQVLNQLWEILISALEQMHNVLGQTTWEADTFVRLFKLLLSQYDVGTIPPVLDAVIAGSVSAMRCQQCKHLIVLGAQEGVLPGYGGSSSVLTEQERNAVRQLGVTLNGGQLYGLKTEFSEIYGVFCGSTDTISVSCSGGQPSFVYNRLLKLTGYEKSIDTTLGTAVGDSDEAAAYLVRWNALSSAEKLGIAEIYEQYFSKKKHRLGTVCWDNIQKLYGSNLNLSASQIDRLAECRFSYFLKYGLRATERKSADIDPAEFGTYVHAVLEDTVREVMSQGGFSEVSMEKTVTIAKNYSDEYAKQRFAQLDAQRIRYLFERNSRELELIVRELWRELHNCDFLPVAFELAFGCGEEMSSVKITGKTMSALLRGVVDRVDLWRSGNGNYFRVVDYKTGRKDFDYCDVFNGIGLQMLLYLFALKKDGKSVFDDSAVPAGVQYFPARVPIVSADGLLSDENADVLRRKEWKRKGLLLNDDSVLHAMEKDQLAGRLPITRKNDGTVTGDLANQEQLDMLEKYVFMLLGSMVDEIASGTITANPYTRGSSHNACTYCPYYLICHLETVEDRRNYKTMTQQRFWEEIDKEVTGNG